MAEQLVAAPPHELSSRIWTVPNVLSMLRLAGVPLFLYWVLGRRAGRPGHPAADGGRGHATTSTARSPARYNQFTRLGQLLDPLADRLYILATLLALVARDGLPLWWALRAHRPRRGAAPHPAGAAPARLRPAAGALPRQGRDVQPALRLPDAAGGAARQRRTARRRSSARWAGRSPPGGACSTCGPACCTSCRCASSSLAPSAPTAQAGARRERSGRREGRRDGRGRGHPAAADDRQPAQAAAAGRQPADHGARPAAAEAARLRRDRRDGAVPRQPGPHLLRRRRRARDAPVATPPRRRPLGTAGSVKNAEAALRDDAFLVISGDALTDIDLGALVAAHRERRRAGDGLPDAGARPARVRHRHHRRGRPHRALPREADLGPGLQRHRQHRHLRHGARGLRPRRAAASPVDWSGDVFPALLAAGRAAVRLRRRGLLGGRRQPRQLPPGAGRRAQPSRSTSRSTASRSRPASGSARAPRSTRTPCSRARCASATTPRSRPAPSCGELHRARQQRRREGRRGPRAGRRPRQRLRRAAGRACAAASSARTPTSCGRPGSRRAPSSATSASSRRRPTSPTA